MANETPLLASLHYWGNLIEGCVWLAIAGVFLIQIARGRAWRGRLVVAAVSFAVFGVSDWVEITTGAWWRPWWLFAWKAACVLTFGWLLVEYRRGKAAPADSRSAERDPPQ